MHHVEDPAPREICHCQLQDTLSMMRPMMTLSECASSIIMPHQLQAPTRTFSLEFFFRRPSFETVKSRCKQMSRYPCASSAPCFNSFRCLSLACILLDVVVHCNCPKLPLTCESANPHPGAALYLILITYRAALSSIVSAGCNSNIPLASSEISFQTSICAHARNWFPATQHFLSLPGNIEFCSHDRAPIFARP